MPAFRRPREHRVIVIEVLALSRRARAAVGDVDRHAVGELGERHAVARIAGPRDDRRQRGAIDAQDVRVDRAGVALHPRLDRDVDAAALLDEAHGLFVGLDDAGEAAKLRGHVGERGALVGGKRARARRRRIRTPCPTPAAGANRGQREQVQHEVLGGDAGRHRAVQLDAQHFGHRDPHGARHERVGHVGRADAERDAAERAAVRRVRIGAGDELARQRVALRHHRVRDALRAGVVRVARREVAQVAVLGEPMARDESAVRVRQPAHAADEPAAHVHRAPVHVGQMVLERDDGVRIVQRRASRRTRGRAGARTCRCSTRG